MHCYALKLHILRSVMTYTATSCVIYMSDIAVTVAMTITE